MDDGKAMRYGVGVGRAGMEWSGCHSARHPDPIRFKYFKGLSCRSASNPYADLQMAPEIAAEAMRAYAEESNRLNRERRSNGDAWQVELAKVEKQIAQIVEAIADGMYHPSMKEKMTGLETRKAELTSLLADTPEDKPDLLPTASTIYAKKVAKLTQALNRPAERQEAAEALRMLIEKIVLTPGPGRGEIDATLHGELGQILSWTERQAIGKAANTTKPAADATGLLVSVVAGAGFEPAAFRL